MSVLEAKGIFTPRPQIVADDLLLTVDDSWKTFMKIQAELDEHGEDMETLMTVLGLALGEEQVAKIEEKQPSVAGMMKLIQLVLAAVKGESQEDLQKEGGSATFPK